MTNVGLARKAVIKLRPSESVGALATKYRSLFNSTWPRIFSVSGRVNRKTQQIVIGSTWVGLRGGLAGIPPMCEDNDVSPRAIAADLFDLLLKESRNVHQRIIDGKRYGVTQYEEGITQSLLLEVTRNSPTATVVMYTHAEESHETGADWAWWWEGEHRWFGALVQAKRLNAKQLTYDFAYRPRNSSVSQIDLLFQAAAQQQLPPLYVLYGGSVAMDLTTGLVVESLSTRPPWAPPFCLEL